MKPMERALQALLTPAHEKLVRSGRARVRAGGASGWWMPWSKQLWISMTPTGDGTPADIIAAASDDTHVKVEPADSTTPVRVFLSNRPLN